MEFGLSENQRHFLASTREFARGELAGLPSTATGEFPHSAWHACARFGVQGWPVPRQHGGRELDPVTIALALDELGYWCRDTALLFALGAQLWAVTVPIVRFGTEAQCRRWLPALADGTIIAAHAVTESGAGSDVTALGTVVTSHCGSPVLTGVKVFITNAPVAGVFLVIARTGPHGGLGGLNAYIVEAGSSGVSVTPRRSASPWAVTGDVVFDRTPLIDSSLLGRLAGGYAVFMSALDWERMLILAPLIGAARRTLDLAAMTTSGTDAAVARAEVVGALEHLHIARLLVLRAAWRRTAGRRGGSDAAIVKLSASAALRRASEVASRLSHADAVSGSSLIEALASSVYSGTSEVQREILGATLGFR